MKNIFTGMPPTGFPPPGLPPQFAKQGNPPKDNSHFSAPPSLIPRPPQQQPPQQPPQGDATISAAPQLTHGSRFHGDATKFMPTWLRVKRQKEVNPRNRSVMTSHRSDDVMSRNIDDVTKGQNEVKRSADDAYDSFMNEMKGLL